MSIRRPRIRHEWVTTFQDQEGGRAMKYLLLVCWGTDAMNAQADPGPDEAPSEEGFPWLDDLQARGKWVTGDQLAPPRRARSVPVRDGKTRVTDGPYAETKEAV